MACLATHEPASAAKRPSGVTAPTTSRPSSVSSTENAAPAIKCPEPHLPVFLGSSPTHVISDAMLLSAFAPAVPLGPEPPLALVPDGISATITLPQPEPTTLGMVAEPGCGVMAVSYTHLTLPT